jgi:hypothetical protein
MSSSIISISAIPGDTRQHPEDVIPAKAGIQLKMNSFSLDPT